MLKRIKGLKAKGKDHYGEVLRQLLRNRSSSLERTRYGMLLLHEAARVRPGMEKQVDYEGSRTIYVNDNGTLARFAIEIGEQKTVVVVHASGDNKASEANQKAKDLVETAQQQLQALHALVAFVCGCADPAFEIEHRGFVVLTAGPEHLHNTLADPQTVILCVPLDVLPPSESAFRPSKVDYLPNTASRLDSPISTPPPPPYPAPKGLQSPA